MGPGSPSPELRSIERVRDDTVISRSRKRLDSGAVSAHHGKMLANPTARLRFAAACAAMAFMTSAAAQAPGPSPAPETPVAWRVECSGDGKTIECRAFQQIF